MYLFDVQKRHYFNQLSLSYTRIIMIIIIVKVKVLQLTSKKIHN